MNKFWKFMEEKRYGDKYNNLKMRCVFKECSYYTCCSRATEHTKNKLCNIPEAICGWKCSPVKSVKKKAKKTEAEKK